MSDFKLSGEMTDDPGENTKRRAQVFDLALNHAAQDPSIALKMALGLAYSESHKTLSRQPVIKELGRLLRRPDIAAIAPQYAANLENVVKSRTIGNRCGDYVSKVQFELLSEAMNQKDVKDA